MSTPFPGMDPYLESHLHWPTFHQQMIVSLAEALQPSLGDRYRLRFGTRTYLVNQVLFTSIIREEHRETYIEIRQRATDRLTLVLDLVSPGNRTNPKGRIEYTTQANSMRQQGSHLIEMDLVLQGNSCLEADLAALSEKQYVVCVHRATKPPRNELYGFTLQKRLPRIRVPLAADDRDLVLDLQTVFQKTYDRFFTGKVDYQKDPPVRLSDTDDIWMKQLLKAAKLR
jgi:hypothetical protein